MSAKTGFNIVTLNSTIASVDDYIFSRAIREFNTEYTPAKNVEITSVKSLSVEFLPKKRDFKHTLCVYWEENEP